uniref:Uncharacterized protein n=1 Tax=Oncorhynchus tshawytscha TaxID=74940 RepID=A0AAZ3P1J2_ONCTS
MGSASSTEGEREPLLVPPDRETSIQPVYSQVYGRRWLVLTLFSLLAFMQGIVWNTWGPIQNSAMHAYDFTKSDIAVLVLWGPVGFAPWLLFIWLMDKKVPKLTYFNPTSPIAVSPLLFTLSPSLPSFSTSPLSCYIS